jgi:sodium/bile acid cotransporter 7
MLIFFASGLGLSSRAIKDGVGDVSGILMTLLIIFGVAPLVAAGLSPLPWPQGIIIGLFLVAVMPCTLSSGVVMTAAAGGNMAHALLITVVANSLAIFTIPIILAWLLSLAGDAGVIFIDKAGMMLRIGLLVLLPLAAGTGINYWSQAKIARVVPTIQILNQLLILAIVWMAVSQARPVILKSGQTLLVAVVLAIVYHGFLLAVGGLITRCGGRGRGHRESIILMGGQKTLPLAILLQMSLFPHYVSALVFCVVHHIVHLTMDAYLVGILKR